MEGLFRDKLHEECFQVFSHHIYRRRTLCYKTTYKSNNNTNHEIKHTAKNQQHLWDKDSQPMLSHAERSATEGNVMYKSL